MKSIQFISLLAVLVMGISSCTKVLEKDPSHSIDGANFFNKIEDYEQALTGAYARLLANSYYGSTNGSNAFVGLPDIMSDNFFESSESLANYQNFSRWTYTADDPTVGDTWLDAYRVVQQSNLVLRGIDKLSQVNAGAVNRIKAQAIALRAMGHFDILRYWGEETSRNSGRPGIAYVDKFDIEQKPARLTVKESYDRIESDFQLARQLMGAMDKPIQSMGTGGNDRSYIDNLVVEGLLARMYLHAGVADSAKKYSGLVINARPLASRTVFPNIWLDASTSEVIWSVKFESLDDAIGSNIFYSVGNRASYRPTTSLLNLYDQVNDVRFSSYYRNLLRGSARSSNPARMVLIKYDAKQANLSRPDGIVNFKAIRTGEMYLIRAEAYASKGMEVQALADLNTLRAARIANYIPVVLSGTALMQAIMEERRKELVAEGHRFFDLKRTVKTINRTTNCINFCQLLSADREWSFPIPQFEMLANSSMQQNQGY